VIFARQTLAELTAWQSLQWVVFAKTVVSKQNQKGFGEIEKEKGNLMGCWLYGQG